MKYFLKLKDKVDNKPAWGMGCLFLFLLALSLLVMFNENTSLFVGKLFGLSEKSGVLEYLAFAGGGCLIILQIMIANRRARAMENTAIAQAKATERQAEANRNTEEGQRQERLKNAIEHLGHQSDSVRLGGAYELVHLAEDIEYFRQTVLDILCAHIRRTTGEPEYREDYRDKPSEEVQSLLTLLFVQKIEVFEDLKATLTGSWLAGANLEEAQLKGVELWRTELRGAHFFRAKLQGTQFFATKLQEANFVEAQLQEANLALAWLQGTDLEGAQLQGATAEPGFSVIPFANRIRSRIGKDSYLNNVTFGGGLNEEDVNSLVEDLDNEKAHVLRTKLEPHIGHPPSFELPEDSGAITGMYTREEAEIWIDEYKKATLGTSGR